MQVLARNMQNGNDLWPTFVVVKTETHIMYIDDDPDDRENIGYALKQCNAKIKLITAVDADDAGASRPSMHQFANTLPDRCPFPIYCEQISSGSPKTKLEQI